MSLHPINFKISYEKILGVIFPQKGDILVVMLSAYSKSDFEDISEADKNELKKAVPILVKELMEKIK